MSKQLFKQPNIIVFWLVLASGVAAVLAGQSDPGGAGLFSTLARTIFWCSAAAYFSLRVYQFAIGKNKANKAEAPTDEDMPDDA
jgi:hypothetical protein